MAAVSNKKGVVGSKGRNMPIMPSMSEVVPTMVYTLTTSKEKFAYEGIPTFAPEHFARVRQVDTMKRKQFVKGINQIAQEGAIQIFQEYNTGMEEIIVGVVGVLQFDVLKYRLKNE